MQHQTSSACDVHKFIYTKSYAQMNMVETMTGCVVQLRVRLGALSRAFTRRSDESAASHGAHRIALATLALQAALEQARIAAAPTLQCPELLCLSESRVSKESGSFTKRGSTAIRLCLISSVL
jgi:hypothetical protein